MGLSILPGRLDIILFFIGGELVYLGIRQSSPGYFYAGIFILLVVVVLVGRGILEKNQNNRRRAARHAHEVAFARETPTDHEQTGEGTGKKEFFYLEYSEIQKILPVLDEASADMLKLFGPRFTNRPGGHIETDIAAAACIAGLQVFRKLGPKGIPIPPGTPVAKRPPGGCTILYEGRAEELSIICNFMEGICEGLELDPKSGWNMKQPDPGHAPLFGVLEMEQMLEKDFLDICRRHNLGEKYYPFVAIMAAVKLVSGGKRMHLLDENTGKELALFYLWEGSVKF